MTTWNNLEPEWAANQAVGADKDQDGNKANQLMVVFCRQVIQTISAVDKDEPLSGHGFYFSLAAPVAGNHNFTLRDNKGETWLRVGFFLFSLVKPLLVVWGYDSEIRRPEVGSVYWFTSQQDLSFKLWFWHLSFIIWYAIIIFSGPLLDHSNDQWVLVIITGLQWLSMAHLLYHGWGLCIICWVVISEES